MVKVIIPARSLWSHGIRFQQALKKINSLDRYKWGSDLNDPLYWVQNPSEKCTKCCRKELRSTVQTTPTTGYVFWHCTVLGIAAITYKKGLYWLVGHKEINLTYVKGSEEDHPGPLFFSSDLVQDRLTVSKKEVFQSWHFPVTFQINANVSQTKSASQSTARHRYPASR